MNVCLFWYFQEKFKTNLLAQSEDFKRQVLAIMEDFHSRGPFGSHIQTKAALALIAGFKEQVVLLKEQEAILRRGLTIFKIDQPPSKDITKIETVGFVCAPYDFQTLRYNYYIPFF